ERTSGQAIAYAAIERNERRSSSWRALREPATAATGSRRCGCESRTNSEASGFGKPYGSLSGPDATYSHLQNKTRKPVLQAETSKRPAAARSRGPWYGRVRRFESDAGLGSWRVANTACRKSSRREATPPRRAKHAGCDRLCQID